MCVLCLGIVGFMDVVALRNTCLAFKFIIFSVFPLLCTGNTKESRIKW